MGFESLTRPSDLRILLVNHGKSRIRRDVVGSGLGNRPVDSKRRGNIGILPFRATSRDSRSCLGNDWRSIGRPFQIDWSFAAPNVLQNDANGAFAFSSKQSEGLARELFLQTVRLAVWSQDNKWWRETTSGERGCRTQTVLIWAQPYATNIALSIA